MIEHRFNPPARIPRAMPVDEWRMGTSPHRGEQESRHRLCLWGSRKQITRIVILLSSCWFLAAFGYAQSVSSTELINNAKNYNGNTVVYEGEVIGDIMVRGEYAWINVNDGKNAIGIWIKKELIKDILYTGNYKAKGDSVEITGKFNRSCPEHGGDLDIHGQSLNKISPGNKIFHAVNKRAVALAFGLFCILLLFSLSTFAGNKVFPGKHFYS